MTSSTKGFCAWRGEQHLNCQSVFGAKFYPLILPFSSVLYVFTSGVDTNGDSAHDLQEPESCLFPGVIVCMHRACHFLFSCTLLR